MITRDCLCAAEREDNKGMENMKNQNSPEQGLTEEKGPEALHHRQRDLNGLEDRMRLLRAENEKYTNRIKNLSAEIERIDSSVLSVRVNMEATEKKIKGYPDKIAGLESKSELLVAELNNIRLKIKSSGEDEESTQLLRNTLTEEYENLKNEKAGLVKRIDKMGKALNEILSERERKLPKLKKYDEMLRQARNVFYDTESRMEISLKLRHGRRACKSVHP